MRRFQLFEVLDQAWCPEILRDSATDCLEAIIGAFDAYRTVRERILTAIRQSGETRVVDLCSGAGGPWLSREWTSRIQDQGVVSVALTDKFPHCELGKRVSSSPWLFHVESSVDATGVPGELVGFRTIFSSFHHFPDELASRILEDAVRSGKGFASAEVTARSARAILTMFAMPLLVWLVTPGIRPFRWSRLFFTYLVPIVPLILLWDGIVSCLRTRTPRELLLLAQPFSRYEWTCGYAEGAWLPPVYLIGVPIAGSENNRPSSPHDNSKSGSQAPR